MTRAFAVLMLLVSFLAPGSSSSAQELTWAGERWRVEAQDHAFERYLGRDALVLRNGSAWLLDHSLEDGTISFDLAVSDGLGFHGLAFRAADPENYEHFYLRPFVSGNPDASQYTPVFNGVSGWQIYADPRFGQAVQVPTDRWMHVEVRVNGRMAEVHVDGEPLVFPALQHDPASGMIALTAGGAPARFANIEVRPGTPSFSAEPPEETADPEVAGLVGAWRISNAFPEARLDSLRPLDTRFTSSLSWNRLRPAVRGIADIARIRGLAEGNTVFAATTLRAARPGPVRLRFGFSDRAHVYLNGRPLFRAADGWRARDYKFLGTIGLHDELVLPLEAGDNELWIAVSESFGGWGVTAQVVDTAGVQIQ